MSESLYEVVASPCVQICQLDADRVCVGCGRSIAEIAEWSRADRARRLQIRADSSQRLAIIEMRPSSSTAPSA